MTRNCHGALLRGVLKVTITPSVADNYPAIVFDQFDHVPHLHDLTMVVGTSVSDDVPVHVCQYVFHRRS